MLEAEKREAANRQIYNMKKEDGFDSYRESDRLFNEKLLYFCTGSVTTKEDPLPGVLSTVTEPDSAGGSVSP